MVISSTNVCSRLSHHLLLSAWKIRAHCAGVGVVRVVRVRVDRILVRIVRIRMRLPRQGMAAGPVVVVQLTG